MANPTRAHENPSPEYRGSRSTKSGRKKAETVREVIGIFFDQDHLKEAINELRAAGFKTGQIGLLASEFAVEKSLADLYTRINAPSDDASAPHTAFVRKTSVGDTFHALGGGLFFVGSTAALGGVVASAAVFGGALVAGVAAAVTVGTIGAVLSKIIRQSDAEYLEQQVDEGNLLLFVRSTNGDSEEQAMQILSKHSGFDVRVHEVPVDPEPHLLHR
jgi:outer membrane lipoprotein SlyB